MLNLDGQMVFWQRLPKSLIRVLPVICLSFRGDSTYAGLSLTRPHPLAGYLIVCRSVLSVSDSPPAL